MLKSLMLAVACAYINPPGDMRRRIFLGKKEIVEKFHPMEWVIRHETAHCNGWKH